MFRPKRLKNEKLLAETRKMPCVVCGKRPSDPDHITSRGAGGDDASNNLWPLCREHHTERGWGFEKFLKKYPQTERYLIKLGRNDVIERLRRKNASVNDK